MFDPFDPIEFFICEEVTREKEEKNDWDDDYGDD